MTVRCYQQRMEKTKGETQNLILVSIKHDGSIIEITNHILMLSTMELTNPVYKHEDISGTYIF